MMFSGPSFVPKSPSSTIYNTSTRDVSSIVKPNNSQFLTSNPFPTSGEKTLFIGEGNFSFSLAWLEKHMQALRDEGRYEEAKRLPTNLIATEHKTRSACERDPFTLQNIQRLETLGSLVLFGIDGQTIDTNTDLANYRITRIQANCLDNGHVFCDDDCELPDIILNTAYAASQILETGDTFQLILLTPNKDWQLWQGVHYEVARVEDAGFYLNEGTPRFTGQIEYPTYMHNKTEGDEKVAAAQLDQMTKYVFVKHPTQRTPSRFKSRTWAHKQFPTGERDPFTGKRRLVPTQHGYYTYYAALPGRPGSPPIAPPSFFNFAPSSGQLNRTFIPLERIDEVDESIDEFDSSMACDDYSDFSARQMRTLLRGRCGELVKKIKRQV